MRLSIIIPALNEEENLPLLLSQIREEGKKIEGGYEVILADAGSQDKTVEIAKHYGCWVIKGGLPGKGRNEGAKKARGDLFLFLDADTRLSPNFLGKSLNEFEERKLKEASFCIIPRTKNYFIKFGFNFFYNWPITFLQKFVAYGAMGILIERNIFEQIGGFDEDIKLGEDVWLLRQAKKKGKFGIIKSAWLYIPLRRFETDGYLWTSLRALLSDWHMFLLGPVKSDVFHYRFGHYKKKVRDKGKKE